MGSGKKAVALKQGRLRSAQAARSSASQVAMM